MALKITTFNCKGFKPRNYCYINKLFSQTDILFLQELWLLPCEFVKIGQILDGSEYHALTDMKDNELIIGRPFGGVAIVYKRNLDINFSVVDTNSNRLCVIKCDFKNNFKFILMTLYMPCYELRNDELFNEILLEISSIYQTFNDYEIIA